MPEETMLLDPEVCKMLLIRTGRKHTRRVPTIATRMTFLFSVNTTEGDMSGRAGDWLAQDADGNVYPISDSVFRRPTSPAGSAKQRQ